MKSLRRRGSEKSTNKKGGRKRREMSRRNIYRWRSARKKGREGLEKTAKKKREGERKTKRKTGTKCTKDHEVSHRHMTWWRRAWWIWIDDGPACAAPEAGAESWPTARRAALTTFRGGDGVGEAQHLSEEAEREKLGRRKGE